MFPLKNRKIGGYKFSEKTWYTVHHLGTDYVAKKGAELYAPFDGIIKSTLNGKQGGLTIWFKPNNANVIMRFMHLSAFKVKEGEKVKEGQVIALTGNTGAATTGAHLHVDISKNAVNIANFSNFLDPEKYQWETPGIPVKSENTQIPVTTPKIDPGAIDVSDYVNIPLPTQNMPVDASVSVGGGLVSPQPDSTTTTGSTLDKISQVIAKEASPTWKDRLMAFIQIILDLIHKANNLK